MSESPQKKIPPIPTHKRDRTPGEKYMYKDQIVTWNGKRMVCPHKKLIGACKLCGVATICPHDLLKMHCKRCPRPNKRKMPSKSNDVLITNWMRPMTSRNEAKELLSQSLSQTESENKNYTLEKTSVSRGKTQGEEQIAFPVKKGDRKLGTVYEFQERKVIWDGAHKICVAHKNRLMLCILCGLAETCVHKIILSVCTQCPQVRKRKSFPMDAESQTKKCNCCERSLQVKKFRAGVTEDGYRACCRECDGKKTKIGPKLPCAQKCCSTCGVTKDRKEFWSQQSSRDGLFDQCIPCGKKRNTMVKETLEQRSDEVIKEIQRKQYPEGVKTCRNCKETLPLSDFYYWKKLTNGLTAMCKGCMQIRALAYKGNARDVYLAFRDGKVCEICGETDSRTFDFAHLDRTTKLRRKSGKSSGQTVSPNKLTESRLREELPKIRCLCVMCHRRESAEEDDDVKGLTTKKKGRAAEVELFIRGEKLRIGKCAKCPRKVANFFHRQFDFDHLPGTNKVDNISTMRTGYSLEEIAREIKKTQLLCCTCHRLMTLERLEKEKVPNEGVT